MPISYSGRIKTGSQIEILLNTWLGLFVLIILNENQLIPDLLFYPNKYQQPANA